MPADYSNKGSETYLNLNDDENGELGDKVQQVRAELESLRQKQEEIEREKIRLEELKRRQDSLEQGRSDMLDKLTRALVVVQRETEESQKRVEQMHAIYQSFSQHLRELEVINSRAWSPQDLPRELSKALSSVEDARAEYIKAQAKLSVDTSSDVPEHGSSSSDSDYTYAEEQGFSYWLKNGFAFTLPLQIIGLAILLVFIWSSTSAK
jgi:molecular chaperone GrpE (heat shock protein)